ncbi:MAG: cytochrome c nitrite reductase small subunit [Planctomycetota bacterium]
MLLSVGCGTCLGLGAYTADYAEATSYLSTDPRACANCHIMWTQFDGWQKAAHHTVATCADCHLPPSGLAKWIAKSINGYRHSKAFTFQDFAEPIQMTPFNARNLQRNCERCHADFVHDQLAQAGDERQAISCVHCHRSVGHGPRAALGGAFRDDELGGLSR